MGGISRELAAVILMDCGRLQGCVAGAAVALSVFAISLAELALDKIAQTKYLNTRQERIYGKVRSRGSVASPGKSSAWRQPGVHAIS
jgi:hypothetical protein